MRHEPARAPPGLRGGAGAQRRDRPPAPAPPVTPPRRAPGGAPDRRARRDLPGRHVRNRYRWPAPAARVAGPTDLLARRPRGRASGPAHPRRAHAPAHGPAGALGSRRARNEAPGKPGVERACRSLPCPCPLPLALPGPRLHARPRRRSRAGPARCPSRCHGLGFMPDLGGARGLALPVAPRAAMASATCPTSAALAGWPCPLPWRCPGPS
jgi:hypothetical protein